MPGAFLGMDPELVRQLATSLRTQGGIVRDMATTLTGEIEGAPWTGADREAFYSDWTGAHVPALNGVADALEGAALRAESNAAEQEATSSAGGGSGSGGTPTHGVSPR